MFSLSTLNCCPSGLQYKLAMRMRNGRAKERGRGGSKIIKRGEVLTIARSVILMKL